jgi:hypothetical protein
MRASQQPARPADRRQPRHRDPAGTARDQSEQRSAEGADEIIWQRTPLPCRLSWSRASHGDRPCLCLNVQFRDGRPMAPTTWLVEISRTALEFHNGDKQTFVHLVSRAGSGHGLSRWTRPTAGGPDGTCNAKT